MENITSVDDIKNAIRFLEADQEVKKQQLSMQFNDILENLKPVNILRNTVQEISSSPLLMKNVAGAVGGLASGYLLKRVLFGTSKNILKRILGIALQFGVTNLISRHPDDIASYGQAIKERIFPSKKSEPENL